MKGMSGMLADAYAACLDSVSTCCAPLTGSRRDRPGRGGHSEKQLFDVLHEQPSHTPAPHYDNQASQGQVPWEPEAEAWSAMRRERNVQRISETRTAHVDKARLSLRKRFRSASGPQDLRRAQISAPYNFRHLDAESYHFPQYTNLQNIPQMGPRQFRPLELSIYDHKRSLSPLLPHFEMVTLPTPPPAAQLPPYSRPDDFDLGHEREHSNMSFHIPRRHQTGGSPSTTYTESPPRIPPKSRARAHTSPTIETMKERIARGLNEMDALQKEIDMVIERQSIYAASSRPSTAYSSGPFDLEPMPSIPACPPAAPSFSERLTPGGERSRTAPARRPRTPPPSQRAVNGVGPAAAFITPPPSREREHRIPPPPLPLVLRPPLRKKKSFSRVSSWLFPGQFDEQQQQHHRDISFDSVTNLPRPIKGREGFYQCVTRPGGQVERRSFDTDVTMSTWVTEEDEQTVPTTTWSPGSSPATKAEQMVPLERTATFGSREEAPRARVPGVVGVAF